MFPLYPLCRDFFFLSGYWILSKTFSEFVEMIKWFSSLILWMCYNMLIDFWIWNHIDILGINSTWSLCMISLMHCWIWFANILFRVFFLNLCLLKLLACNFLSFFKCLWFWYQDNAGIVEWVWKFFSHFNFLE